MTTVSPIVRVLRRMAQAPIYAYRYTLSPLIGPVCRFQPTCSAYALEAIETHGVIKGSLLTLRRLSRCHPVKWLGGSEGYDPVPARAHHDCHSETHR